MSNGPRCANCGVGRAIHVLPGFRQREAAIAAREQFHAEPLFERLDLATDRGLRDEQLLRGLGKTHMPRGRFETPEEVQRRNGSGLSSHS